MKKLIQKITSHTLFKNSAIVFAGTVVGNISAYLYHLLMGRWLGPAGYGEFSSLLSILYIVTVPLTVCHVVLVKFIATIKATGQLGQAKSLPPYQPLHRIML